MLGDRENNKAIIQVILLAAFLSGLAFYLQSAIDINLADEGYFLTGAVRTAMGKVPIRDFYAYDPGRYYWMAAWSSLFGEGLVAMRFYLAFFGGIGLCLGLLAARRAVSSFYWLIPLGVFFTIWIFPRYHTFEITFAMATVFFVTRLIEAPTFRRYFWSGVFVGVAAFFGRNLGLYGLLAITVTALYIWLRLERGFLLKSYASFVGGIFIGYSPIFIMAIFIPGFFHEFIDSILFFFRVGGTNLPLPVPWPWYAISTEVGGFALLRYLSISLLFFVMPLGYLLCLIGLPFIKKEELRSNALFTASLFTGVFYLHPVFSRPDIEHLARGIHPFFLLILAFFYLIKGKKGGKILIVLMSLFFVFVSTCSIIPEKPFIKKNITQRGSFIEYPVRGDKIWLHRGQVIAIDTIVNIIRKRVPPDEALFIAPFIPTMYYILEREVPTRNTYFLSKRTPWEQKMVIESLEAHDVRWAIVGDIPLDGRDDLRFSNTYNLVWAYFQRNYVLADPLLRIPGYVLIHKRDKIGAETE